MFNSPKRLFYYRYFFFLSGFIFSRCFFSYLNFPICMTGWLTSFSVTVIKCPDKSSLEEGGFILAVSLFMGRKWRQQELEAAVGNMYAIRQQKRTANIEQKSFLSVLHILESLAPSEVIPTIKVGLPTSVNLVTTVLHRHVQRPWVSQVILDSVKLMMNTNHHQRSFCFFFGFWKFWFHLFPLSSKSSCIVLFFPSFRSFHCV